MKSNKVGILLLVILAMIAFASCRSRKLDKLPNKVYIEKNYKELKELLPEAQVTIVNDTIKVLFPNNLLFKTAQSDLSESVDPLMERFGKCLNKYKKTSIMIAGHTDNVGNFQSNIDLSTKRAESAMKKLVSLEVIDTRLSTWGHGDQYPVAPNDSEGNKAMNRRVEFIIMLDTKG